MKSMNSKKSYIKLLRPIKDTAEYRSFFAIINEWDWEGIPDLVEESKRLFDSRKVSGMRGSITMRELEDVIAREVSLRARLVVVRATINNTHSVIEDALNNLREDLYYSNPLGYKPKTVTELRSNYRSHCMFWIDYRELLVSWLENLDNYLDDMDKAMWSIKSIILIRDISSRKEWSVDK